MKERAFIAHYSYRAAAVAALVIFLYSGAAAAAPTQSGWNPASGSTITTTSPSITITLDVNGDCKWSLTNQPYTSMTGDCTGDASKSITCATSGLAEGANSVYTACRQTSNGTYDTPHLLSYTVDSLGPSGGSLSYTNGYITTTSVTITLNQGTDTSGIASVQLQRSRGTLSAGACASFGAWSNIGTQSPGSTSATDSSLASARCYMYRYVATDNAGNATTYTSASVLKVDTSRPSTVATVNDGTGADISSTTNGNQLSANWTASSDAQSGITKYWYAIGTTSGGTNVVGWTDNGLLLTVTHTGLNLTGGTTYFVSVKAQNGAGRLGTARSSNGQQYVDSAPPVQGPWTPASGACVPTTSPTITFSLNETGDCKWATSDLSYSSMTGDCAGDGTFSISCAVTGLAQGAVTVYSACRDQSAALNADTISTNTAGSYTVDTVAPSGGSVSYTNGYTASTSATVTFTQGTDPSSTIVGVQLQRDSATLSGGSCGAYSGTWTNIGTQSPGATSATDSSLTSGNCYIYRHTAADCAGNTGIYTSASVIKMDSAAPTGGSISYLDGFDDQTSTTITLNQGTDAASGIASVQLKRDTAALSGGSCGAFSGSWTNIGTQSVGDTSAVDSTLSSGNCYKYEYVVTDAVGNIATFTSTAILKTDMSAPIGGSVTYTNGYTSSTSVTVTFNQGTAASGIASVQLQRDEAALSGAACGSYSGVWTNIGTQAVGDTSEVDSSLVSGKCYIYRYSVVPNAGNTADNTSASALKVDTSAPAAVATVNDGTGSDISFTASSTQLSANWTASSDAQSGIVKYWYAIGTTAGATNIVGWTDNGASLSVTKTGLSLSSGQAYYFSVKAENGSGLQSTAANSNGQTVDTAAPSGGSLTYNNGFTSSTSETITLNQGTDPLSGIVSVQLQRDQPASLTNGVCGSFSGVWGNIGTQSPGDTSYVDSTLASGNCYRYRYTATDAVGNIAIYTSNRILIVDGTLPTGGSISYADGYITVTTTDITFDEGDAVSGIDTVQLQRDEAPLTAGTCGAYSGTWTNIGNQFPGDIQATDSSLVSGNCYIYVFTVTSNSNNNVSYTSANVIKVDSEAPIVSAVLPASDAFLNNVSVSSGGTTCSDSASGLAATPYDVQWCNDGSTQGGCVAAGTWNDSSPVGYSATNNESFTGADGTWYRFRARCRDILGNISGWTYSTGYALVDVSAPANPTASGYDSSSLSVSLTDNGTYGYDGPTGPYFQWTAPSDNPSAANSGIAGYYVYFGSDSSANPTSYQAGTSFTNSASLTSGTTYYLRIKTQDNAGNVSSAATVFTYKYSSGGTYIIATEVDADATMYGTDAGSSDGKEGALAPDNSDFEIVVIELKNEWDQTVTSPPADSTSVTVALANTGSSGAYIASTSLGGATAGAGVTSVTGTLTSGKAWVKIKANGSETASAIDVIPSAPGLSQIGGRDQEAHILVRPATGVNIGVGTVTENVFSPAAGGTVMNPVWSHNGDEIVVASVKSSPDNGWNLYKLKWNGSGWDPPVKLTNNAMCVQPHSKYTFTADDSKVMFSARSSCSAASPPELYAVSADGSDSAKTLATLQSENKKSSDAAGYLLWDAAISSSSCSTNAGRMLAAMATPAARGDLELYMLYGSQNAQGLFTLSGSTQQQVTNIGGISVWSLMGSWSPDCSKIAFVSWSGYGSPTYTSIYSIDLNTAALPVTSLTAPGVTKVHECSADSCAVGPALYPEFSSDGTMVSYMADPSKSMNLYNLIISGTSLGGNIAASFFGAAGVNFNNYVEYIPDQPVFSPQLLGQSSNNEYGLVQCSGPACPNSTNGKIFSYITQSPGQTDGKLSFLELANESSINNNGGLIFYNGAVTAVIPPGAIVQGEVKLQATDPLSAPATTDSKDIIASTGEARDFFPNGVVFSKDIRLVFQYCDTDSDGFLDNNQDSGCTGGGNSSIDENHLYVYYWCEVGSSVGCAPGTWLKLEGYVDPVNDTITVVTNHFSLYDMKALLRGRFAPQLFTDLNLTGIRTYPNPWITGGGSVVFTADTTSTYNAVGAIQVDVDIFDVRGKHVRKLLAIHNGTIPTEFNGLSLAKWDARNSSGKLVASGVYPYVISVFDGVFRKHYEGKLSIVR